MKNNNIQYEKECLENGICPECGDKLRACFKSNDPIFWCDYCVESYDIYKEPYNIKFEDIDWFNY